MASNKDALIGYSGFVGSMLQRQAEFAGYFRSNNMTELRGQSWDTVYCAAAPAAKWIANRDPIADRANIDTLISSLDSLDTRRFILISTVDVFLSPVGVDENSAVEEVGLHSYGLHRRLLERFVADRFDEHLIVRLPGLVGPGLKKNVIYDFLHDNNVQLIDSRGVFQFYPMINLFFDISRAVDCGLRLLHLTSEPVSVADLAVEGFNMRFENVLDGNPATYDMRSIYAEVLGGTGDYQYSRRESLQAVRAYAQSEPRDR